MIHFVVKPIEERRQFLISNGLCSKCCGVVPHKTNECRLSTVSCGICKQSTHPTGLHIENKPLINQGGESVNNKQQNTTSKCTQICGEGFAGKSCAKIVQVKVYHKDKPENYLITYCIIDEQSNRSLVKSFGENECLDYPVFRCR